VPALAYGLPTVMTLRPPMPYERVIAQRQALRRMLLGQKVSPARSALCAHAARSIDLRSALPQPPD